MPKMLDDRELGGNNHLSKIMATTTVLKSARERKICGELDAQLIQDMAPIQ